MEDNEIHKFKPIEITTHNLYFHENSPILSTDFFNGITATCGYDNAVRLWKPEFTDMRNKDNVYRTSTNSSITFNYYMEFNHFSRPINCLRFYKGPQKNGLDFILAACCDGGKVVIMTNEGCTIVRNDTSDDAYELCWGKDKLLIGFASGRIEAYIMSQLDPGNTIIDNQPHKTNVTTIDNSPKVYLTRIPSNTVGSVRINTEHNGDNVRSDRVKDNTINSISEVKKVDQTEETIEIAKIAYLNNLETLQEYLNFRLIFDQQIHTGTIQGMSYNEKYKLIATHSLDKTLKVHMVEETQLVFISSLEDHIDHSRGLFKRILFEEDSLYIFIKNKMLHKISYPFKQLHLQKKIGPFNSAPVKVLSSNYKNSDILYICTNKSVYILDKDTVVCVIDNCAFMAITDAFVYNGCLIVSSLDGFLASIRLT